MTPAKMIRHLRRVHMETLCSPYLRSRGVPRMLERAINTIEDVYNHDHSSPPKTSTQGRQASGHPLSGADEETESSQKETDR